MPKAHTPALFTFAQRFPYFASENSEDVISRFGQRRDGRRKCIALELSAKCPLLNISFDPQLLGYSENTLRR
jgi:hypothetical protein